MVRAVLVSVFALGVIVAPARAGDRELLSALTADLSATSAASRAAAGGAPSRVQAHYDRARSLQERVRAAAPYSAACHSLGGWAARYASAEVSAAEAFDRLQPDRARTFRRSAAAALTKLTVARRSCRVGTPRRTTTIPVLTEPRPGAVTFGSVVARAPAGTDAATLYVNGAPAGPLAVVGSQARAVLVGRSGRYTLEVRFLRSGAVIGTARSAGVWFLAPPSAGSVREPEATDALQAQVRATADRFSGQSGIWLHNLATGRAGSWNAGAKFPAASLVKLAVLVEAVRRMGPQPEGSALLHDARAIAAWSSNLGANRLLRRIGGSSGAQRALDRMGATSSTYTGPYIVATERPPVAAPDPPPRVSGRVTTAADMGTLMRVIHEAAIGNAGALTRTGLTAPQARLVLGLLLSSEQSGDNLGIFRGALGGQVPAAQKQGWISSARHSAAVVYTDAGPVVVVALTYQPGLSRSAAAVLGGEVVRLATSPS